MRAFAVAVICLGSALSSKVSAQTWTSARGWPPLWQIIAIDQSAEPSWPYGPEDVAGDGLGTFQDDEARADLRTLYADADAERLWLRAYVVSASEPAPGLTATFFLDADARVDTGGPAYGDVFEPRLTPDPTRGGYERAIAVRGDGTVVDAWEWNAQRAAWQRLQARQGAIRVEVGRARDPLGIGAPDRGYLQTAIEHALSGLNASCAAQVFVRLRYESAPRSFGDDAQEQAACRAPVDAYGDPVVLRSFVCDADADCPRAGRCRDGVCLFAYDCGIDADCRTGEHCSADQCVRAVTGGCSTNAECAGLVCEAGSCVSCTESGTRACADGRFCSPNGSCIDAEVSSSSDRVQGGAFHCAAAAGSRAPSAVGWLLSTMSLLGILRSRRRWRVQRARHERTIHGARRP